MQDFKLQFKATTAFSVSRYQLPPKLFHQLLQEITGLKEVEDDILGFERNRFISVKALQAIGFAYENMQENDEAETKDPIELFYAISEDEHAGFRKFVLTLSSLCIELGIEHLVFTEDEEGTEEFQRKAWYEEFRELLKS